MPSTVNVGTLEGLLRWKVDGSELDRSLNEVAKKANVSRTQLNQYNKELLALTTSYNKTASSINPSIAATQKYERAQSVLSSSLKAGIISQQEYSRQIELAAKKYDSSVASLKAYSQELATFGGHLSRAGTELTKIITLPIVAAVGGSIKAYGDFNAAMVESESIMSGLDDVMRGRLEKTARELSKTLSFSAKEGAQSYYYLTSAGLDAAQSLAALPAVEKFAQAGAFDLSKATSLLADSQSALGLKTKDAQKNLENMVRVSDVLNQANIISNASTEQFAVSLTTKAGAAMRQLGIDVEAGTAVLAAWADQGIKAELAGERFYIVVRDLQRAYLRHTEAFQKFGITVYDTQGNFRPIVDIIANLEKSLGGMSAQAQKQALMMLGFQDRSMQATQSLIGLSGKIREYEAELRSAGGVTETVAQRQLQSLWKQLELLKNKITDVAIELGKSFAPAMLKLVDSMDPAIKAIKFMVDGWVELPPILKVVIGSFGFVAASIGPVVFISGQLLQSYSAILAVSPRMAAAITSVAGPWGILAAAIIAATIALSAWITKWKNDMQTEIEQMVSDANRLGTAFDRLRNIRETKTASSSDLQKMSDELSQISDQLDEAKKKQTDFLKSRGASSVGELKGAERALGEEIFRNVKELESRKKVVIDTLKSVENITDEQKEQVDQTVSLGEEMSKQQKKLMERFDTLKKEREEDFKYQTELKALSEKGLISSVDRIKEENKINTAHEYRLDLLKYEEKYGIAIARLLADNNKLSRDLKEQITETNKQFDLNKQSISESRDIITVLIHSLNEPIKSDSSIVELTNSLAKASLNIRVMRSELVGLNSESQIAKELQLQLKSAVKSLSDAYSDSSLKIAVWLDKLNEPAEKGIRIIKEEIDFIERRNKALLSGPVVLSTFDREEEIKSRTQNLLMQLKKMYGETAEDWTKRWLKAAKDIKEALQTQTDVEIVADMKLNLLTSKDQLEAYKKEIERLSEAFKRGEKNGMDAATAERLLADVREREILAQMDQWQGLFSYIGGLFGGLAQKISNALSNIQSAYQQGKKLDMSGFGSSMGMSGSWGAIFAEVQLFYEAYVAVSDIIKSHKAKTWGTVTELEVIKGQLSASTYFNVAGREISNALRKMVQDIVDSLGAVVDNLPEIAIRARHDGKQFSAYVAGVWVGTFKDMQAAVDAGVASALEQATFSHISEEFKTALQKSLGAALEELKANLDIAKSAREARIGPTGSQYLDVAEKWNSIISASRRLGLAVDDEIRARNRELQSLKMQALGIDTSTSDMLANLGSLSKGINEASGGIKSTLEQQIADITRQIAILEDKSNPPPNERIGEGPNGNGPPRPMPTYNGPVGLLLSGVISDTNEELDKTLADLKARLADYTDQLNKVPNALSDQELNLGVFKALFKDIAGNAALSAKYAEESKKFALLEVEIKYAQIKEQLMLLGKWEEFAGMFSDALAAARQAATDGAKPTRGGRGGGGEKDSVHDFIKGKTFDLSLTGLTDYEKQKAQILHQYDEELDKAGKDKKLRDQLLALRDEELKQLKDEQKELTKGRFREFMGLVTPFEKTRKTATDLIKEINGSPFGNAQKVAMVGRVMEELDRQLNTLSKQMTVDLFGNMLSDMEKFGATDEQMRAAREAQAILQHELTMADYAIRIAQLEAEGRVSQETLATLHSAYDLLAGVDPTKFIPGNKPPDIANDNYSYTGTTFDDFQSLLKSVQDKLAEWNRIPLSETLSKAHELTDSYDKLMEDVNELIPFGWDYRQQVNDSFRLVVSNFIDDTLSQFEDSGNELEDQLRAIDSQFRDINSALIYLHASQEDLTRAETDRLKAVNKLLSQYLDPINERLRSRQIGEHSILTPEQQYLNAQRQFRDLYAQIQSGDLSHISDVVSLADQYESLLRSSTGGGGLRAGLSEIDNALISIRDLVPEFAQQMAEVGTEDNPMVVDNRGMINAIQDNMEAVNNGNNLMLVELRDSVNEMRNQSVQLSNIERILANPLSVRNVA